MIYSIVAEDLPSGVGVSLDGENFVFETNGKVIFADVGTIAYTDANKTKSHTITFKATSSADYVSNQEVNINVIARQYLH